MLFLAVHNAMLQDLTLDVFQMLLAVIEKRLGLKLSQKDIFLNIAGGLKNKRPSSRFSSYSSGNFIAL